MDNHQLELAEELEGWGHVIIMRDCTLEWTTKAGATKFWESAGLRELAPFHLGGRGWDDQDQWELDGSERYVSGFQMMANLVIGYSESWSRKNS